MHTSFFATLMLALRLSCAALLLVCSPARTAAVGLTDGQAFALLHEASETIYDGDGSWGREQGGYRMALRDSAWRAEVYGHLADSVGSAAAAVYRQRAYEAIAYLLRAQSEGGTGVFGFPADENNPEFGAKVRAVTQACPACLHGGWIVTLPGDQIAELYYDHGHALAAVAQAYRRGGDPALLEPIHRAAQWALGQPLTRNINYLSSLAKGLSLAAQATGDVRYLERAVALHREGILPFMDASGRARDRHNGQLEYHGFIVSGLVALRAALPHDHTFAVQAGQALAATARHMAVRGRREAGPYGATWPGTTLLAWHELSRLRPLSPEEAVASHRARALIRAAAVRLVAEDGFRLRKALYSHFFIGLQG